MGALRPFEWDEAKAETNLQKHGIGFEEAIAVFLDPALFDFDASQAEDGEDRRKAVGVIAGRVFVLVYTLRSGTVRVISARRANVMEVRRYADR